MLMFLWNILRTEIPLKGGDNNGREKELLRLWMHSFAAQKGEKV